MYWAEHMILWVCGMNDDHTGYDSSGLKYTRVLISGGVRCLGSTS
jgi:hypothetical protein